MSSETCRWAAQAGNDEVDAIRQPRARNRGARDSRAANRKDSDARVHHAPRGRQLHRERDEEQPHGRQRPLVPRQTFERSRVDVRGRRIVGFARVAREKPLQILGLQIADVGLPELVDSGGTCSWLTNSERPADAAEHVECELQILARMRGGDDGPHARFVARDGRKRDALREDAGLEQPIRQRHRRGAVADEDRRDRALADAGVEAQRRQARLEETRVVPQPIDELRLVEQDVDRRNAGGGTAGGCDVEKRNGRARWYRKSTSARLPAT